MTARYQQHEKMMKPKRIGYSYTRRADLLIMRLIYIPARLMDSVRWQRWRQWLNRVRRIRPGWMQGHLCIVKSARLKSEAARADYSYTY